MHSRLLIGALAAALTTNTTLSTITPAKVGPPWISIEHPVNPYDASTRGAFLLVHAFHHGTPVDFPVTGTAEGLINGQRRSVSLEFRRTSRPGVFALHKQWADSGAWSLVVAVTQGPEDKVYAVVDLAGNGDVAKVRVPTRRQGDHTIPAPVAMREIDGELRRRGSQ